MSYRYIHGKFNNKIEKYLELSEIAEMLKEYKKYYNVYRCLLVIHMVANLNKTRIKHLIKSLVYVLEVIFK